MEAGTSPDGILTEFDPRFPLTLIASMAEELPLKPMSSIPNDWVIIQIQQPIATILKSIPWRLAMK